MKVLQIYKCLCDELRLRILNLLMDGPLCVCHLVEILECEQVRMSKQLRYMKELGMVVGSRQAQWIVYRLAEPDHPLLAENLKCLQDCAGESLMFSTDRAKRAGIMRRIEDSEVGKSLCCPGAGPSENLPRHLHTSTISPE
jgi:ArsR family transcriptional regulator, arsenate/arsenite/antimonite-responsive transcriptional repressor